MPTIKVDLPDGQVAEFPEGTPIEAIEAAIREAYPQAEPQRNLAGATAATLSGVVNGLPIVGPAAQYASDAAMGGVSALTGGDYGQTVEGLQQRRAGLSEQYPVSSLAGNVAGAATGFGVMALPEVGSTALGLLGSGSQKVYNGLLSSNGIGIADRMIRKGIR